MIRRAPIKKKPRSAKASWRNPERVRVNQKDYNTLRIAVFERACGRCENARDGQRCPNKITWWDGQMHHLKHASQGGADSLENCIAVCNWGEWPCHRLHHDGKIKIEPWWKQAA